MIESDVKVSLVKALAERGYDKKTSQDVAFHLTDWMDDLSKLHAFYSAPDGLDSQQVEKLLTDFLIHVPNHVAAASKLLLDIPVSDVFNVGAVEEIDT